MCLGDALHDLAGRRTKVFGTEPEIVRDILVEEDFWKLVKDQSQPVLDRRGQGDRLGLPLLNDELRRLDPVWPILGKTSLSPNFFPELQASSKRQREARPPPNSRVRVLFEDSLEKAFAYRASCSQ
jgi:hypothetical protein